MKVNFRNSKIEKSFIVLITLILSHKINYNVDVYTELQLRGNETE